MTATRSRRATTAARSSSWSTVPSCWTRSKPRSVPTSSSPTTTPPSPRCCGSPPPTPCRRGTPHARLVIKAPEKRCGKSRLLDLIEALCHKPLMTANASPSAVYRSIGADPDDPPAPLMDEADTIFGAKAGDGNEDLRGLLNAGHQRNRPALRYDAGLRRVEHIPTFAMAALAGIGNMPDTIEDRAVIIAMRRRAPDEIVKPYRARRDGPALAQLQAQLHAWVRAHLDELEAAAAGAARRGPGRRHLGTAGGDRRRSPAATGRPTPGPRSSPSPSTTSTSTPCPSRCGS